MSLRLIQAALLLGLSACGNSTATTAQPTNSGDPPFQIHEVATFDNPWAMAFIPGGSLALVTEKPGRVWLFDVRTGSKQVVAGPPEVVYGGQGGLLDVVLSPTFATDKQVYLTYAEPSRNGGSELALARAMLADVPTAPRLDGLRLLWHDPAGGRGGQFGGIIAFAPDGKSLFLSSGERQRFTPAQDMSQPLGKILHLTLDGKPAPGNPWAGQTGASSVTVTDPPENTQEAKTAPGHRVSWPGTNLTPSEVWSLGHRNPYGLAFAPDGRLWETEMGPRGGDELNLILPGKNYDGVPIAPHSARPKAEPPKLYWVPSISPTSLLFYTGNLFPQWKGSALIGALSGEVLVRVTIDGDHAARAEQWSMGHRIRFVGQGPEGAVYLLEDGPGARMLRLTPAQTRR